MDTVNQFSAFTWATYTVLKLVYIALTRFQTRIENPLRSHIWHRFRGHEREKRRVYDQRVREVERGTFTPLVLTATGGMGPSASIFFQKLAAMIAAKRGHTYQRVITWIRQRLTFSLLRSAISAIRATRFLPPPPPDPTMISILTSGGSGRHWRKI